ncbi:alpha/beta hydrolase family esterase [Roseobacter sinensis]|uniref:Polyhydroxybutyrate depolymerase n=1 Tax=Roseobacter sinensis TaxID=2931391 RepID=A0ABT3BDP0_9RHOB|nr:PHB depolymerase family esterase [Roseobacter sp. WL0113]MCV3271701.1 polyhydroxybutyrate depolymerase [Roseobacter sp. WL0113]
MKRRIIASFVLLLLAQTASAMGPWKVPCDAQGPCNLGDRSYHVKVPDGWDGLSPMPVLLHFHGWQRRGALPVRHQRISGATRRRGVLLLAPNGLRKTWNFWDGDTEDVGFAAAVLEDAAQRYPIDRQRIYISGYSFGAAMAWRFVCENGDGIAALLAVSGTLQQSEECPQAPREVRHVHGLADTVMDFPMGPGGDETYPVALWRDHFSCTGGVAQGPWSARAFLTFQRTTWECDGGRVSLDLHPGGHVIPHGWLARQLDELLGQPATCP